MTKEGVRQMGNRYAVYTGGHDNRHVFVGLQLPNAGMYDRDCVPVAWMEKNPFFKNTKEAEIHEKKMIELAGIMAKALTDANAEIFTMSLVSVI